MRLVWSTMNKNPSRACLEGFWRRLGEVRKDFGRRYGRLERILKDYKVASKLYGVNATIIVFVFVLLYFMKGCEVVEMREVISGVERIWKGF